MCEDENISRTVDYDGTGGNDNGSGVSRDKPDDDITDRLNDTGWPISGSYTLTATERYTAASLGRPR